MRVRRGRSGKYQSHGRPAGQLSTFTSELYKPALFFCLDRLPPATTSAYNRLLQVLPVQETLKPIYFHPVTLPWPPPTPTLRTFAATSTNSSAAASRIRVRRPSIVSTALLTYGRYGGCPRERGEPAEPRHGNAAHGREHSPLCQPTSVSRRTKPSARCVRQRLDTAARRQGSPHQQHPSPPITHTVQARPQSRFP